MEGLVLYCRSQIYEEAGTTFIFSQCSQPMRIQFGILPLAIGLFKLMFNLICIINIQGREPAFGDIKKYMFMTGCRFNASEPFFFKLGMMKGMSKLYMLVPV